MKELTDGRGADVVIEVVGLSPALQMGFDLLRPWGFISSVGVHNAEVSKNEHTLRNGRISERKSEEEDKANSNMHCRSHGVETRLTERIYEFKWVAAPCDQYFQRH